LYLINLFKDNKVCGLMDRQFLAKFLNNCKDPFRSRDN